MDPAAALTHYFGHDEFRPGQEKVVRALLAKKSALAIFPTGGGKSLCFQLPALLLPGLTLVVSPLIALMKDQVETLVKRGISAARLDSTLSEEAAAGVYAKLRNGELKLLYIAPERLANEAFLKQMRKTKVSLLAIDEAHCISEWGHNFRPDYLRLAKIAQQFKWRPILALTATATPQVAEDMALTFHVKKSQRVVNSFLRSNLALHVTPCPALQRLDLLTQKLQTEQRFPAIVYVTQQHTAEHVATHLARQGVNAQAYHAGLVDEYRSDVQSAFMHGETQVIVATIAFGMGIDKANVRSVYHYNLPKTLENYQQEIGRAGRDGAPAHVEVLACQDDLTLLRNFIHGDTPTPTALRQLVDHLLRRGREVDVSHYELTRVTDIRPAVMETVLTYLEMEGLLEPSGSFYAQYRMAFERAESQVLSGFPVKHRQFLEQVFATGKRWWKWLTVDIESAGAAVDATAEEIIKALQDLEEAGEIVLKPGKRRQQYRLRTDVTTEITEQACTRMQMLFAKREAADLARLEEVLTLMQDHRCLTKHLLGYFGEKLRQPCGICTSCQENARRPRRIPSTKAPTISDEDLRRIQGVIQAKLPALRSARQITRFLCGIKSPAAQRDKLMKHDAFGMLERVPFAEVLLQVDTMLMR